jgi:hypothetical protein
MGNKFETDTVEGMRKVAHASIDDFFNNLPTNPDGTPVDEVELRDERHGDGSDGVRLVEGRVFGVMVHFARPKIVTKKDFILGTPEGKFRLVDRAGLDALVRLLVDTSDLSYDDMVEGLANQRTVCTKMPITEVAQRTNLLFEPAAEPTEAEEPVETEMVGDSAAEKLAREKAEIDRLAAEKPKEDDTQQLTPEKLGELRQESLAEEEPSVDEPAVTEAAPPEDTVVADTELLTDESEDEPAPEKTSTKSRRRHR